MIGEHRQPDEPGVSSSIGTSARSADVLRGAATAILVVALLGAVAPGRVGDALATAATALAIGLPLVRVAITGLALAREGDVRFAAAAFGVLAVVGTGAFLA